MDDGRMDTQETDSYNQKAEYDALRQRLDNIDDGNTNKTTEKYTNEFLAWMKTHRPQVYDVYMNLKEEYTGAKAMIAKLDDFLDEWGISPGKGGFQDETLDGEESTILASDAADVAKNIGAYQDDLAQIPQNEQVAAAQGRTNDNQPLVLKNAADTIREKNQKIADDFINAEPKTKDELLSKVWKTESTFNSQNPWVRVSLSLDVNGEDIPNPEDISFSLVLERNKKADEMGITDVASKTIETLMAMQWDFIPANEIPNKKANWKNLAKDVEERLFNPAKVNMEKLGVTGLQGGQFDTLENAINSYKALYEAYIKSFGEVLKKHPEQYVSMNVEQAEVAAKLTPPHILKNADGSFKPAPGYKWTEGRPPYKESRASDYDGQDTKFGVMPDTLQVDQIQNADGTYKTTMTWEEACAAGALRSGEGGPIKGYVWTDTSTNNTNYAIRPEKEDEKKAREETNKKDLDLVFMTKQEAEAGHFFTTKASGDLVPIEGYSWTYGNPEEAKRNNDYGLVPIRSLDPDQLKAPMTREEALATGQLEWNKKKSKFELSDENYCFVDPDPSDPTIPKGENWAFRLKTESEASEERAASQTAAATSGAESSDVEAATSRANASHETSSSSPDIPDVTSTPAATTSAPSAAPSAPAASTETPRAAPENEIQSAADLLAKIKASTESGYAGKKYIETLPPSSAEAASVLVKLHFDTPSEVKHSRIQQIIGPAETSGGIVLSQDDLPKTTLTAKDAAGASKDYKWDVAKKTWMSVEADSATAPKRLLVGKGYTTEFTYKTEKDEAPAPAASVPAPAAETPTSAPASAEPSAVPAAPSTTPAAVPPSAPAATPESTTLDAVLITPATTPEAFRAAEQAMLQSKALGTDPGYANAEKIFLAQKNSEYAKNNANFLKEGVQIYLGWAEFNAAAGNPNERDSHLQAVRDLIKQAERNLFLPLKDEEDRLTHLIAQAAENSFQFEMNTPARKVMEKWGLDIKNDEIFLNDESADLKFQGVKSLTVTSNLLGGLRIEETDNSDPSKTYVYEELDDPARLVAKIKYTGIVTSLESTTLALNDEVKGRLNADKTALEQKYPALKSQYPKLKK